MPTPPNKCIASLNLADESGFIGSQDGALLVVELQSSFVYGSYIVSPFRRTYAFNASGFVQTTSGYLTPSDSSVTDGLVETESLGIAPYRISVQYQDGSGELITNLQTSNMQIPNQASVDLSTLLDVGGSSLPLPSTFPVGILKGTGNAITVATAGTDYSVGTSALATGLIKSTTGTGAISIGAPGTDYSAGTSALATGILKTTTTTGALSVAVAGDFPTLNQNTTGTALNVTGTVAIANGGTGQTSANNALNALLPSQATNTNKVLKTDGTNTSWVSVSASSTAPTIQKFTSGSGTYTTPTSPAPLYLRATIVGGGGGGGGNSAGAGSGAGGGGGTSILYVNSPSATYSYTVGAGGAANNTGNGSAGGTSSFSTASATGGGGGIASVSSTDGGLGGAGGAGSSGTINFTGSAGGTGTTGIPGTAGGTGGTGGSSSMGGGGVGTSDTQSGSAGGLYGGGGGGASNDGTGAFAGAAGIVVVEEFYQ